MQSCFNHNSVLFYSLIKVITKRMSGPGLLSAPHFPAHPYDIQFAHLLSYLHILRRRDVSPAPDMLLLVFSMLRASDTVHGRAGNTVHGRASDTIHGRARTNLLLVVVLVLGRPRGACTIRQVLPRHRAQGEVRNVDVLGGDQGRHQQQGQGLREDVMSGELPLFGQLFY